MKIVGVLPMAGSGSRLGLPFHKSLAPTFDDGGSIVPVYEHSRRRLNLICDEIVSIIAPEREHDPCLKNLPMNVLIKDDQGEAPSSVALAGSEHPRTWLAMSLPDTIWYPHDGFVQAKALLDDQTDGVLMLFEGPGYVLDEVICKDKSVRAVIKKTMYNENQVVGWGAFIVRSDIAATWTDEKSFAEHLSAMNLKPLFLGPQYFDIGTVERYTAHLRGWL